MRAKDALLEACSARQLELFAEALAESERAELVKPSTPPDGTRSAAGRAALTKPSAGGQSTLPRLSVSPGEAAEILGVSRDYFDEHVIDELRVVRRGRRILVALAELERWLDRAATRASVGRA